jgi:alpha-beta hydrolase superfamily lysophospholipase
MAETMTSQKNSGHSKANSQSEIVRREGHFHGDEGLELFYQSWASTDQGKRLGTLVITHGISEHSECYAPTAEGLVQRGWNVIAWDLRGHGRSEGRRGFVGDFVHYVRDLGYFLLHLERTGRLEGPFALIGHSMGGLITLRHLIDNENPGPRPQAIALSSPLLGLSLAVPVIKDLAAKMMNRILPSFTMHNELKYEDLTRDPERLPGYGQDPLRHDKISPSLYLGMLSSIEYVKSKADRIRLPVLIQAAGKEKIVSLSAIREFFPQLASADKKLSVFDESYHEIFNDLDREDVFNELHEFLKTRMKQENQG